MNLFNRVKSVYVLTSIFHTTIFVAATTVTIFGVKYFGGSNLIAVVGALTACLGGQLMGANSTVNNLLLAMEEDE